MLEYYHMFDFQQKRKMKSIVASRVTQALFLILAIFVLISAYNRYLIARDMDERRSAVESEIEALETRRQSLEKEVNYLTNERGIEAELRRQFDITREGEQLIIILDDENKSEPEVVETTSTTTKRAWYRFW